MRLHVIFISVILLFISCVESKKQGKKIASGNHYATGFEISKTEDYSKLKVVNPFEKARNIAIDYYLFKEGTTVPDSLKSQKIIFTPIKKIICLSTSHVAFLDAINETDKIVGVSGSQYVSNKKVEALIDQGKVVDVGYGQNLNYELILQQKPDLIMVYGVGSEVSGSVRKLEDLGMNVVLNGEYLESSPLGKAEWVKFVAEFFQKSEVADNFFYKIETEYNELKKMALNVKNYPKVLVGLPYKDSWWIPGGNSYMANLISDAGGNYLGKNNNSHESYVVSFENALLMALQADVWINTGALSSKEEILSADERFSEFEVFKRGEIYNNNARMSVSGGNDFWESGTIYPNLILADLIKIMHPKLIADKDFTYYQELN